MDTEKNERINKTPFDIKIVSILLFMSAISYFSVNTGIYILYGFVIKGFFAQALWIITCLFCLACAYGFWKNKLFYWKLMVGYILFYMGDMIINYIFIPIEDRDVLFTSKVSLDQIHARYYFCFLLFMYILFLFYLFKRKKFFK